MEKRHKRCFCKDAPWLYKSFVNVLCLSISRLRLSRQLADQLRVNAREKRLIQWFVH